FSLPSFIFSSSTVLSYLHSFPTRRSSDLMSKASCPSSASSTSKSSHSRYIRINRLIRSSSSTTNTLWFVSTEVSSSFLLSLLVFQCYFYITRRNASLQILNSPQ